MSNILKAHIALFIVNLIYGANYIIAKGIMPDYLTPDAFIFLRASGALFLFSLIFLFNKERIDKKDWLRLAACGLFGVAANQLFFFHGLSLTSPINSAIIMTSNPIVVLILSAIVLNDSITKRKISGVVLGMAGAVLLIWLSRGEKGGQSNSLGDLFILINSLSYAVYLVLVKPLMAKYKPITVITLVFMFGFLFVLPFGLPDILETKWDTFTSDTLLSITYVVVGVTFLAYLLSVFALRVVSPSVTSTYIYLQPVSAGVFAIFHAWMYDSQYANDITFTKAACTLMIFAGVYLVSKPARLKIS